MKTEQFIRENFDIIEEDFTCIVYDNTEEVLIWEKPSNPVAKLLPLIKELGLEIRQTYTPYTYLLVDVENQISMQLKIRANAYEVTWNDFELTARNPFQALCLICAYFDFEMPLVSQLKSMVTETADKATEIKLNDLLTKFGLRYLLK